MKVLEQISEEKRIIVDYIFPWNIEIYYPQFLILSTGKYAKPGAKHWETIESFQSHKDPCTNLEVLKQRLITETDF